MFKEFTTDTPVIAIHKFLGMCNSIPLHISKYDVLRNDHKLGYSQKFRCLFCNTNLASAQCKGWSKKSTPVAIKNSLTNGILVAKVPPLILSTLSEISVLKY